MSGRGRLFLLLASVGLPLASHGQQPVDFQSEIAPLLRQQCTSCHLTGDEPGGLALHPRAARASLVGVESIGAPLPRVAPGDPSRSYLLMKLEGTHLENGGSGDRMPLGFAPLPAAEIERLRQWIAEGAQP